MSKERWLPVPDYPDYAVSDHGQVRSFDRFTQSRWGTPKFVEGRILKQVQVGGADERRYCAVTLYRDGEAKQVLVHTLVLEVFVSPRPDAMQGLHGDDDTSNNHLSNLYWGTPSRNGHDAVRNGRNRKSQITECPQGHKYTEANTYRAPRTGHRQCRACQKAKNKGNANSDRVKCPQGHPYDAENTYLTKQNRRMCKTCVRDRAREYQRRKRASMD